MASTSIVVFVQCVEAGLVLKFVLSLNPVIFLTFSPTVRLRAYIRITVDVGEIT